MATNTLGFLIVVVACVAIAVVAYPPAPGSGGAPCKINAQCGMPAANCPTLREQCVSLTGTCTNGVCACATDWFCCGNCHGQATLQRNTTDPSEFDWSAMVPMMDGSGRVVSVCSVPHGGGRCTADAQCGLQGGLCLAGQCVCPQGWICPMCSMTITDLQYGLRCGIPDGGAKCTNDTDCHHGHCVAPAGGFPPAHCECDPLWACADCSKSTMDLAANRTTCS